MHEDDDASMSLTHAYAEIMAGSETLSEAEWDWYSSIIENRIPGIEAFPIETVIVLREVVNKWDGHQSQSRRN